MTRDTPTSETTTVAVVSAAAEDPGNDISAEPVDSHYSKSQTAIQSLSAILPSIPPSLSTSPNPSHSLLHDPQVSTQISTLLRHPSSGTGDNHLCRWLYDTFQSGDPHLQLVVICYVPVIACAYLSRATLRRPLAGFEAILLALYAHETTSRAGQPLTVNIPDMSHPSLYHEPTTPTKNNSTSLHLAVVSPSLEPHRTVRSTRRAWIVGVAMELYYSKIYAMPTSSKVEFCEFVRVWAGEQRDESEGESGPSELGEGKRISLPWELLQPIMRTLGHCVVGCGRNKEIFDAAMAACKGLHGRAVHDINPKAILATESLLRLGNISLEPDDDADYRQLVTDETMLALNYELQVEDSETSIGLA
ncbi:uncharacterized protein LOC133805554 [Humulus lupulus]|uniref:uncharacterized protein LOC133805554 n=1 Tax=Humulus lupulus TaxID=3486 RepID=UPI002B412653|nr:uncharacterized protein LOC133805554 [Humulus lupulus]